MQQTEMSAFAEPLVQDEVQPVQPAVFVHEDRLHKLPWSSVVSHTPNHFRAVGYMHNTCDQTTKL